MEPALGLLSFTYLVLVELGKVPNELLSDSVHTLNFVEIQLEDQKRGSQYI